MVIILDSDCVHKGMVKCSLKWQRRHWTVNGAEVGHRDLWEHHGESEGNGVPSQVTLDCQQEWWIAEVVLCVTDRGWSIVDSRGRTALGSDGGGRASNG